MIVILVKDSTTVKRWIFLSAIQVEVIYHISHHQRPRHIVIIKDKRSDGFGTSDGSIFFSRHKNSSHLIKSRKSFSGIIKLWCECSINNITEVSCYIFHNYILFDHNYRDVKAFEATVFFLSLFIFWLLQKKSIHYQ